MSTSNTKYQYDSADFSQAAYSSASTTNPQGKSHRYTEVAESNNDAGTFVQRQYEETGKPTIQSVNQIEPHRYEDPRVDERMMRKIGQVADMDPTRPVFGHVEQLEDLNEQVQRDPERHHEALDDFEQHRSVGHRDETNAFAAQPGGRHGGADDFEQHRSKNHRDAPNNFEGQQYQPQQPTRHHKEFDNPEQRHPLRHQDGVDDLEQEYFAKPDRITDERQQPSNTASTRRDDNINQYEQHPQSARHHHENTDNPEHHHRGQRHDQDVGRSDDRSRRHDQDTSRYDDRSRRHDQDTSRYDDRSSRPNQDTGRYEDRSSRPDQDTGRRHQNFSRRDPNPDRYNDQDRPTRQFEGGPPVTDPTIPMSQPKQDPFEKRDHFDTGRDKDWSNVGKVDHWNNTSNDKHWDDKSRDKLWDDTSRDKHWDNVQRNKNWDGHDEVARGASYEDQRRG